MTRVNFLFSHFYKDLGEAIMNVGLIRCQQTEDACPATTDFKFMREKLGAFKDIAEEIEVIGVVSCGGCPGKRAVFRAKEMVRRGADTIVFASCITRGNPIEYSCPHAKAMVDAVKKAVGEGIQIIDYTH